LLALSPPYVLPASVAHDNETNVFSVRQTIGTPPTAGTTFANAQLEVVGTGHPSIVLTDTNQAVDQRKARLNFRSGMVYIDQVNDAENALVNGNLGVSFDRAGNITATGSVLGTAAVNTNGTMYAAGTITGNPVNSAGAMTAAGLISAAALSVSGDVNANVVYGNAIHSYGTLAATSTLNVSGKQTNFGGSDGSYSVAPLEIQMPANPRVAFHWPGAVASQIGMDSAGTIRTYDNPGTGYAAFACAALNCSIIGTGSINCTNINTQGYNVTTGTLNVSGQTWVGAIHSYGACNSASVSTGGIVCTDINQQGYGLVNTGHVMAGGTVRIGNVNIQGDDPTGHGLPFIRASNSYTHMVINGPTLYFNLDVPGNGINFHGPCVFNYSIQVPSIANSTGLAAGLYTPTDAGAIQNVATNNYYQARWLRVGNCVTCSGQIDVAPTAIGVQCWMRMYLPTYILQGGIGASGGGVGTVTSTSGGETGYCNVSAGAGHVDIIFVSNIGGIHGMFYHFTYYI
jgi:hypothetical protein